MLCGVVMQPVTRSCVWRCVEVSGHGRLGGHHAGRAGQVCSTCCSNTTLPSHMPVLLVGPYMHGRVSGSSVLAERMARALAENPSPPIQRLPYSVPCQAGWRPARTATCRTASGGRRRTVRSGWWTPPAGASRCTCTTGYSRWGGVEAAREGRRGVWTVRWSCGSAWQHQQQAPLLHLLCTLLLPYVPL